MSQHLKATGISSLAQSRARAERRANTRGAVKGVRERLNSATGQPLNFEQQIVTLFAGNHRNGTGFQMAFSALVMTGAFFALPWPVAGAWALMMLSAHAVVIMLAQKVGRIDPETIEPVRWVRSFSAAEAVRSVIWGLLPICFYVLGVAERVPGVDALMFTVLVIVVATSAMLNHHLPIAAACATTPFAISYALSIGVRGDVHNLLLAGGALGVQLFFLIVSQQVNRTTLALLEVRAQKDDVIAELEQQRGIAEEARRRADDANLAKSRFLATMSHELRTPLNAILGFSEVLKSESLGPLPNDQYREYSKDIHDSGSHLLNLINEILDLSRIEAGRHELVEQPVQVAYTVEEAAHLLAIKARAKNLALHEHYDAPLPKLWADERAIRQITLNLLSNAIKFTPLNGDVFLSVVQTRDGGQMIEVRDTGPGIPEEEIPVVLSSFGQGSIAIKNAEQGTGLGLPIVQALVKTHGGQFELTSQLRQGTTVRAYFPPDRVMAAIPPIQQPRAA
ncbi:MAG: HAMP domain-containing sensor histidine kinase [Pseudomonadota bacterium]